MRSSACFQIVYVILTQESRVRKIVSSACVDYSVIIYELYKIMLVKIVFVLGL